MPFGKVLPLRTRIVVAALVGSSFANGAAIVSQASIQASGIATTVQSAQAIFSAPSSVIGSKVVDKAQANRGDTLTYTIAIKNNSGTPASNLQVVDPLPQDVTFVNNSLTTPALGTATIDSSKRTVTWNIPTLAAGATDAITLTLDDTSDEARRKAMYAQMQAILPVIGDDVLRGLGKIGEDFPELASEIFVDAMLVHE